MVASDLVGAWYALGASLSHGRPIDAESGWPLLTTREALEVAQSWGVMLARLGGAVEPLAYQWLEESRELLRESQGPDELLPTSPELWQVGAELVERLAGLRNADARAVSVAYDDKGRLLISNLTDASQLEYALRRFFIARGRTEKKARTGRSYVEVTVGEATQLLALWDKYAATTRPVEGYRDPRVPWREFATRARSLIAGKNPNDLYPVEDAENLWAAMRRLGIDLAVVEEGQPQRSWSDFVDSVKDSTVNLLGGAKDAAYVVGGATKDAARAVAKAGGDLVKPILLGAGALGGVMLLATLARK